MHFLVTSFISFIHIMASKSLNATQLQLKQLQYKSQIIKSYIKKLETTLRAYNARSTVSGDEQFLSITKMSLFSIQQQIEAKRSKEHSLKLANHTLRTEIDRLQQQHDALREDIKSQEMRARSTMKNKVEILLKMKFRKTPK